jgi:hypothetical protein
MSNEPSQMQQMKPYLMIAGVLVIILLLVIFWPSQNSSQTDSQAIISAEKMNQDTNAGIDDMVKPEVFEAPPKPAAGQLSSDMDITEFEADEIVVDMPEEVSDATVKSALMMVAASPTFAKLLVNERLIEKFVINVSNLSNNQLSPKDALVVPPEEKFKTYNQADRVWIDNSSFQRYNGYVDALESVDTEELLAVFDNYESNIREKFAEISRPGQNFDSSLIDAINTLLDTPQVPVPIEVYSESVVYKFKDEQLEALSGPQKQLIRTGPENMRRIKDVLRSVKQALEDRNE